MNWLHKKSFFAPLTFIFIVALLTMLFPTGIGLSVLETMNDMDIAFEADYALEKISYQEHNQKNIQKKMNIDKIEFFLDSQWLELNQVQFLDYSKKNSLEVSFNKAFKKLNENIVYLQDNVQLKTEHFFLTSPSLIYNENTQTLNSPYLIKIEKRGGEQLLIEGYSIHFDLKTEVFKIDKNVYINKKSEHDSTQISGDEFVYRYQDKTLIFNKNSFLKFDLGTLKSKVMQIELNAQNQPQKIVASEFVEIKIKENIIQSREVNLSFQNQKLSELEGQHDVVIIYPLKDDIIKMQAEEFKAHYLENGQIKYLELFRNVKLISNKMKSFSEEASLYPEEKYLILKDKALLQREGTEMQGEEMKIFLENQNIEVLKAMGSKK